jgi:hypothetical protein
MQDKMNNEAVKGIFSLARPNNNYYLTKSFVARLVGILCFFHQRHLSLNLSFTTIEL